jgi:hypothetical protein
MENSSITSFLIDAGSKKSNPVENFGTIRADSERQLVARRGGG